MSGEHVRLDVLRVRSVRDSEVKLRLEVAGWSDPSNQSFHSSWRAWEQVFETSAGDEPLLFSPVSNPTITDKLCCFGRTGQESMK